MLDQTYTVIGVYKLKESILTFLNADGIERVYIPFTSVSHSEDISIQNVMIQGESLGSEKFREEKLEQHLSVILNTKFLDYRINDFYVKNVFISQWRDIFIFAICLWSFFLFVKMGWKYI